MWCDFTVIFIVTVGRRLLQDVAFLTEGRAGLKARDRKRSRISL
jgi:hypothetical protein